MGIAVYMHWIGQSAEEKDAQMTGFSQQHGHVGYLREAYHGEIYATAILISEDWDKQPYVEDNDALSGFVIPNTTLASRLSDTLNAARERARTVYRQDLPDDSPILKSYEDFVALHKRLESQGKQPRIYVSY